MKLDCLTCGKETSNVHTRYFVVPGFIMVPNSYTLCDEHKNINYYYNDIYDEEGKRKKINHDEVIKRSTETEQ